MNRVQYMIITNSNEGVVFLLKKWLSKSIILCLLVTMLLPNLAFASVTTVVDELTNTSTTIANVAKKNSYTNDLLDVCYFPYDKKFYIVGKDGFLLSSYDDTTWARNAEASISQSTTIDFIDIDCTDNYIVILGVGKTDGKSYTFVKYQTSAFTKTELNAKLSITGDIKASGVAVYENAGNATIVIVEENTGNHIYSKDSGQNWARSSINGYATGSTAVTVDRDTGVFYTYNNNAGQTQYEFYSSYTNVNNSWSHSSDSINKFTTVSNVYKNSKEYVALMHNDTSSHIYTIQMQGGNKSKRETGYVAEAAYFDTTRTASIYVGWKDDFMVIRSSFDPNISSENYLLEKLAGYEKNSIVGKGKLYGVAAGKNASNEWIYIAVGSRGTVLKSTDGYNWSSEAQTSDSYNTMQHVAISEKPAPTSNEIMAVVTGSNNVLYSTDLGATWQPVHRIAIKGEVKDIRFIANKLIVTENIISTGQVKIYTVTNAKEVSTATIDDFVVSGVTSNNLGPVLYGKRKTADIAKVATYDWRNSLVTRTYDAVPNDYMSIPAIPNLTLYAKMGTKEFFVNDTAVYMSEYNGSSAPQLPNTYSINGLNAMSLGGNISYKYYAQVGNHYVFMSANGDVRVSKDVANTNYFSDTSYFTEKVINSSFGLTNMIYANGLLVALAWGGQIYTSFDGIEWTHHETLSYDEEHYSNNLYNMTLSIGHNSNKIVLGQENNTITILTVPYNALTENKVTPYPQANFVRPVNAILTDITSPGVYASIDTSVDPNASSVTPTYQWYLENSDGDPVAIDGATDYRLDLSTIAVGRHNIYVEVTYSDAARVDQPSSSRLYGPYAFELYKNVYDVEVTYSSSSFELVEGYDASQVTPITATIENIGNQPITNLEVVTSGNALTVSDLSSPNLAVGASVNVNIVPVAGLSKGSYAPEVTVRSTGNFSKSEPINVDVQEAPYYNFTADLAPASLSLDYNYDSADAVATVTIENNGNRNITDLQITLDTAGSNHFQVSATPASIGAGQTETVEITPISTLQPGSTYNYTVTVTSQGQSEVLSGSFIVAEAPRYELTLSPVKNNVSLSDDYTDAALGQLEFKISNTGNRDISDVSISLEGDDAASFTLGAYSTSIAAAQFASVVLTPDNNLPIGEYIVAARVTSAEYSIDQNLELKLIVTNIPVYSQVITIEGEPLENDYYITLDHGYSTADGELTLIIYNTGNQVLVPVVSTLPLNVIDVPSQPSSINPGESAEVTLQVKQNFTGTWGILVNVYSTALNSSETVSTTGTVTFLVKPEPVYSVDIIANRDEATLVENYSDATDGQFTLTITNNGNEDLTGLTLTLSDNDHFTSSKTASFDLNANYNQTVYITPINGLPTGTYEVTATLKGSQISDTPVTMTLNVNSVPTNPSLTVSADRSSATLTRGYSNAAAGKYVLTINNDGDQDLSNLSISLSNTKFTAGSLATELAVGESTTVEITPVIGLSTGTHNVTATVKADEVPDQTVDLSLRVNSPAPTQPEEPAPVVTPSPEPSPEPSAEPSPTPSPAPSATPAPSALPLSSAEVTVTTAPAEVAQAAASTIEQRGLSISGDSIINVSIDNRSSNGSNGNSEIYAPIELTATEPFTAAIFIDENGNYHPVPVVRDSNSNTVTIYGTASGTYMLVNYENTLTDVNNHWASNAIQNLSNRLILQGNANGEYKPENSISRSEVAAIVVRALGLTQGEAEQNFTDVPADRWDAEVVEIAAAFGLINGYSDGSFHPTASITREDAMVIIARVANMLNLSANVNESALDGFSDTDQISGYAKNAVALAVSLGIVNGNSNGTLAPKAELSRAEFAVIIERLLGLAGLID